MPRPYTRKPAANPGSRGNAFSHGKIEKFLAHDPVDFTILPYVACESADYRIEIVYRNVSDVLRVELTDFWLRNGAITNIREARRRTDDVVAVMRNRENQMVAVNSVDIAPFRSRTALYYFFRQFTRAADRVRDNSMLMFKSAVAHLRAHRDPGVRGIVFVAENPKLTRAMVERKFTPLGFAYQGKGPRGFDVWKLEFNTGLVNQ